MELEEGKDAGLGDDDDAIKLQKKAPSDKEEEDNKGADEKKE